MKKTLYIAAFILSTGVLSSCSKENAVAPTSVTKTLATTEEEDTLEPDGGQLGTGDGGVDRPPVKKPK